jgi:hypothetical protein
VSDDGPESSDDEAAVETSGSARRLTISPIGFDIVLALSQAQGGLRLAEIAHTIGSPVSSVQTALRVLVANRLVGRVEGEPPRYRLLDDHPAATELASLATVLPEPERALSILFRANPAVSFAGVDAAGFIIAVDDSDGVGSASLDRHLTLVGAARPSTPNVLRMSSAEFRRMLRVSIGVRARVRDALVLRGSASTATAGPTAARTTSRAAG